MTAIKKQIPGQPWIFKSRITKEEIVVILPNAYGESTDEVYWNGDSKRTGGGMWKCRKFVVDSVNRRTRGQGPKGLLSRMKYILSKLIDDSKRSGYQPPNVSPEQMVTQWEVQKGLCVACLGPIKLFGTRKEPGANYDHNHETGEGRGFMHGHCNAIEGYQLRLLDSEFEKLFSYLRRQREKES
jgi:hypothetical protein